MKKTKKNVKDIKTRRKKFCRCVLHVAKNNSNNCNKSKKWGNKCYNPYAICARSVGTTTGRNKCGHSFKNRHIKYNEVLAYSYLYYKEINNWAKSKGLDTLDNMIKKNKRNNIRNYLDLWYNSK